MSSLQLAQNKQKCYEIYKMYRNFSINIYWTFHKSAVFYSLKNKLVLSKSGLAN